MIELQLAHGDPDNIAAIYNRNRNGMLPTRFELMQWWADRIDIMRDGERLLRLVV